MGYFIPKLQRNIRLHLVGMEETLYGDSVIIFFRKSIRVCATNGIEDSCETI